jgi:hypothetical protein
MQTKNFQRTIENFQCEHCGTNISGNGYTNHCSECLWSKHVDINPGDRAATCGGLMRPTALENENGEYVITHTCEKCKHTKRNKISANDNFDSVVKVAAELADMATGYASRAPLGAGSQSQNLLMPSTSLQIQN